MRLPNANESGCMNNVLGEKIRLGEFKMTEKAIELCNLTHKDKILVLSCGMGAMISYLYDKHRIKAVGIDPSKKQLNIAKENCDFTDVVNGTGEVIALEDESFDCVISEFGLSFMNDITATIQEVNRILKNNGWFVVTDVYSKNPSPLQELQDDSLQSGMSRLQDLDLLQQTIDKTGFKIVYLGDYNNYKSGCFVMIAKRGDKL